MKYVIQHNELYHYGIKGMRWGIRRYQNPDGSLTTEGRKRARSEYKADNKKAFELGKEASIDSHEVGYAKRVRNIANKRFSKKQTDKRLRNKLIADRLYHESYERSRKSIEKAKAHEQELIKKYGKEAIKNIKYDKYGRVNERVSTGKDYAKAFARDLLLSAASFAGASSAGLPFYFIYAYGPDRASDKAFKRYNKSFRTAKKDYKLNPNKYKVVK